MAGIYLLGGFLPSSMPKRRFRETRSRDGRILLLPKSGEPYLWACKEKEKSPLIHLEIAKI
jgi:hypothetical protein